MERATVGQVNTVASDGASHRKQPPFRLCLNLATVAPLAFESQVKVAARAGYGAVGLRLNAIQEYVSFGHSPHEIRALLHNSDLIVTEMNFFPDWIYTRSDAQEAMLERFKAFSQLSTSLGAECLNVSTQCDGIPDENLAKENFRELCRIAAADGATVGLEFVPWSPIDTVKKAWSIIGGVDHPCGGLVFDIFHYFKGGSQLGELKDVPLEKIFAVHLTDVREADVDVTTLCRNYRVLPGEGVFVFDEIIDYFVQRGYYRYYALEILNKDYRADQCLGIAMRGKEVLEHLLTEATQRVRGA